MKIKISERLYVDSRTLFRLEWKKFYPVLVLHEKYEKKAKWILRVLAFVGIASSVIAIPLWYLSLGLSIIIFGLEQFFEKIGFEYTTIIFQPPPEFTIDYSQWITNAFMIPLPENKVDKCYFGPSYRDKEYAQEFFKYLKSWNNDSDIDKDNNIVISFIIEATEEYTTYLYANPDRKNLNELFSEIKEKSKLSKYGKKQQRLVFQSIYWHTLPYRDGLLIKQFLEKVKPNGEFFFTPTVFKGENVRPEYLYDDSIFKFHYKI